MSRGLHYKDVEIDRMKKVIEHNPKAKDIDIAIMIVDFGICNRSIKGVAAKVRELRRPDETVVQQQESQLAITDAILEQLLIAIIDRAPAVYEYTDGSRGLKLDYAAISKVVRLIAPVRYGNKVKALYEQGLIEER